MSAIPLRKAGADRAVVQPERLDHAFDRHRGASRAASRSSTRSLKLAEHPSTTKVLAEPELGMEWRAPLCAKFKAHVQVLSEIYKHHYVDLLIQQVQGTLQQK